MKFVISFILLVAVFITQFFFGISGLLGYEYTGIDEGREYFSYVIVVFVLTATVYLYATVRKGIQKGEVFLMLFIGSILLLHLAWNALAPSHSVMMPNQLYIFLSIGLVGALAGLSTIKFDLIPVMRKQVDIIAIIFSASIFMYSILPFFTGVRVVSLGGATYQFFSYFSAITFGFLVYSNYVQDRHERFTIFQNNGYVIFSHILMMFAVLGVLLGGGRGAFVVIVVYGLVTFFSFLRIKKVRSRKSLIKSSWKFLVFLMTSVSFFYLFRDSALVKGGINRATSFIDGAGINLAEGSSGRDHVYKVALQGFLERPLFGYGPFNVNSMVIHPHNFFLELALQFGVVISFILISVFLVVVFKLLYKGIDGNSKFIVFIGIYPLVMLQFSGSYLTSSVFWFVLTYFVVASKKITENKSPSGR